MKNKIFASITTLSFIVGFTAFVLAEMGSESFRIPTAVLSGGGAPMSSGSYRANATLGQPSPLMNPHDPLSSPSYYLYPGFWYTGEAEQVVGGVFDADNDGIPEDGDGNGTPGDNPCTGGEVINCDDNCPDGYNPNQEDTYPPGGNGIGDACDCEGDFNCDGDVDSFDITAFLADFGRGIYVSPCESSNPCSGDFSCDGDVDSFDITLFLEDFGRGNYVNPCPACEVGDWCSY